MSRCVPWKYLIAVSQRLVSLQTCKRNHQKVIILEKEPISQSYTVQSFEMVIGSNLVLADNHTDIYWGEKERIQKERPSVVLFFCFKVQQQFVLFLSPCFSVNWSFLILMILPDDLGTVNSARVIIINYVLYSLLSQSVLVLRLISPFKCSVCYKKANMV